MNRQVFLRILLTSMMVVLLIACNDLSDQGVKPSVIPQGPISSPSLETPTLAVTSGNEDDNEAATPSSAEVQPVSNGLARTPDGAIDAEISLHQEIAAVVWSDDSTRLAVVDSDDVWVYDLMGDEVTRRILDDDAVMTTSVAFSPSGEQIAVGSADGLIQLWQVGGSEPVARLVGHEAPVTSLAFSPDGALLASGAGQWFAEFVPRAEGVETRLWDITTGELRKVLSEDTIMPPVSHLAFSPDGAILAVGQQGHGCTSPRCADGRLRFWQLETDAMSEMIVGHDIAYSDDGRFAAALGPIAESGRVQIWEVLTGNKLPLAAAVHEGFAFDLALSQDGAAAAVVMGEYGLGGQTVYVWEARTGAELAVLESGAPVALSSDGRFLVTSPLPNAVNSQIDTSENNALRLWDVRQGLELVRLPEVDGSIGQLAFSPDDSWLAATEVNIAGSRLHLIAVPQPPASQNVGDIVANPTPTATSGAETIPAEVAATSTPAQVVVPTATSSHPPSPTPPPPTATAVRPEPTTPCPAVWFMRHAPDTCPEGPPLTSFAASQRFERGRMIWVEETDTFYIFFNLGAHPYDDRLVFETLGPLVLAPGASVDNRVEEVPPPGLLEPISGFGLIWRGEVEGLDIDLPQALGWAVEQEYGYQTQIQCQRGETYSARTCFLQEVDGSAIVLNYHAVAGNVYWRWVRTD